MSRGPHKRIPIPPHWWAKLEQECRSRGINDVKALCDTKPGIISPRTITDAWKNPDGITEASLDSLALLLGYTHRLDLIEAWGEAADTAPVGTSPANDPAENNPLPENIRERLEHAKSLTDADKYIEAIPIYEEAVSLADLSTHPVARVKARINLAHTLYEAREDFKGAERHYKDALGLVPPGHQDLRHNALHGLGDMLLFAGRLEEANATIATVVNIAESSKKPDLIAPSLISKSLLERALGVHEQALETLNGTLKLLLQQELGLPDSELKRNAHMLAICYINKARLCRDAGNDEEALECYRKAELYHRKAGDALDAGKTLLFSGEAHCANADWEKGAECFQAALKLFTEIVNPLWGARALENLAKLFATHEQWEEAAKASLSAVSAAKEAHNPEEQVHLLCLAARLLARWQSWTLRRTVAATLHHKHVRTPTETGQDTSLSMFSEEMDKAGDAIERTVREDETVRGLMTEAKDIARKETLHRALAECILDEIHTLVDPDDSATRHDLFNEAIKALKAALAEAAAPNRRADLMGRISGLYREIGDKQNALLWLHKAGAVFEETGDPRGLANYYGSLAHMYRQEGRLEDEVAAYRKVMSRIEGLAFYDLAAGTRINLASALMYKREFDEAQRLLDEAEALCEKHEFKDFIPAIARNRSSIRKELQASQVTEHTLPGLLDRLRQLYVYRPDLKAAYLLFWLDTFQTQMLSVLRSGPRLTFVVVTDDVDRFLNFADTFRNLADHFLMASSSEPTVDVPARTIPIPPEWKFPSTFTFVGVRRAGGGHSENREITNDESLPSLPKVRLIGPAMVFPKYTYVGNASVMTLENNRIPQEAVDLMINTPIDDLIEKRALWMPIDRWSSIDAFLTDLQVAHERRLFPVYLDRLPTSDNVAAATGVRVRLPKSLLRASSPGAHADRWTSELLKLTQLPKDEAQKTLLGLPDVFEDTAEDTSPVEVYLYEFSEIGKRILHPVLLFQGAHF